MTEVKGGIVAGLGVMGSHHLRVLGSLPGAAVAAVVDPDAERVAAATDSQPGVAGFATIGEALGAVEADFACLSVPVGEIPGAAREAFGAGLAVLAEKPLAPTEEEAQALIAEAAERGLLLGVGHVERFNPAVIELKRRLEEGALGRIYQLHARRLSPFPVRQKPVGVALDLATHDIDVMRYLTGAEVERVFAEAERRVNDDHEDLICATLRFDSGVTGLLEVNWLTPTKVRELTVTGEGGMFVVNYNSQELSFYEDPRVEVKWDALAGVRGPDEGNMTRYAFERREPLVVEWEAFLGALREGLPAPVAGGDGLAALSTALAIQRSGAEHVTVRPGYRS